MKLAGLVTSLALAATAGAAHARAPELPRDLRGRLGLEVKRCRPIGQRDALLEARVRLRARETAVALPALYCGAYDDGGAPFFLTPVAGRIELRAEETRELTVRFAADAKHRECGCTVRDVRALADDVDAEFAALVDELAGEPALATAPAPPSAGVASVSAAPSAPSAPSTSVDVASAPADAALSLPFTPPRLRHERMLAPGVPLRAEPSARAAATGEIAPGSRIAVDRIERGWKLARTPDGLMGWLPSDAATPDVGAPERLSERLAPLRSALAPGASTSEALCDSLPRAELTDLVAAWRFEERAVYVRPLWHALAREDRDAFQIYASECFAMTRVVDALSGREIRSEAWEPSR
ncbi:MAG TPA: SH3 domain-containing protein [Myxococcota bacterium]|nr:SH3 domain-containing protein [Myxococcota bacterium]